MKTDPLTLDLGQMRYSRPLEPTQTLHADQVREVLEMIRESVGELPSTEDLGSASEDKKQYRHRHQAILVQGKRGAGKTTLLLTVGGALGIGGRESNDSAWLEGGQGKGWIAHVHALPHLDPTLVEGDEVFLGTIIANILRSLERKHGKHLWVDHPKLGAAFEALAKSLRVLAPDSSAQALKDAAANPDLFAERLLSNALSGLDLAACFHDFCLAACQVLGVRLLLQPIDDADVSIQQGWDVLETVRRYLCNAQILPVMLGDLDLFRAVIEQQQLERLDELKSRDDITRQIAELSEQYLLKLLRPERRVRLPGAIECLESALERGQDVRVLPPGAGSNDQPYSLTTLLRTVGDRVFGISQAYTGDRFALFSDNVRESRGVLMWLAGIHGEPDRELTPRRLSSYLSAFNRSQAEHNPPPEALDALMEGRLDPWMRWLVGVKGDVREPLWVLDLLPDNRDAEPEWLRALKFTIAGILYLRWQAQRAEQLRYFGTTLSPMTEWPEPGKDDDKRELAFRERLRLGRGEPAWLTAARVTVSMITPRDLSSKVNTVYFRSATRLPPRPIYRKADTYGRVISELLRHSKSPRKKHPIGLKPWLEAVAGGETLKKHRAVEDYLIPVLKRWWGDTFGDARLILSWFTVTARRGSRTYELVDPWKGIAAVGDLARAWRRVETLDNSEAKRTTLESILRRVLAQSELSIPVVGDGGEDGSLETVEDIDDSDAGQADLELSDAFLDHIVEWLDSTLERGAAMAPNGWAQVAQRFGDNLNRINEALDSAEHSAGADLERWVLAFLNNVLYVEAEVRGKAPTARGERLTTEFNNRSRDSKGIIQRVPFSTNLRRINPSELPVFRWLAQCPLLTAVLSEGWRDHLRNALDKGLPDGATKAVVGTATGTVAKMYEGVDIHTTLCALVPRFSVDDSQSKSVPKNLGELREQARELLGWATDDGDAAEDDVVSDADA